LTRVLCQYI